MEVIDLLSEIILEAPEATSCKVGVFGRASETEIFRPLGVHGAMTCSFSDIELVRLLGGSGFTRTL